MRVDLRDMLYRCRMWQQPAAGEYEPKDHSKCWGSISAGTRDASVESLAVAILSTRERDRAGSPDRGGALTRRVATHGLPSAIALIQIKPFPAVYG